MWKNFHVEQCRYTGGRHVVRAVPMSVAVHIICYFYVCARIYKDNSKSG